MSVPAYEIDPSWGVVRDVGGDVIDDSECETCEVCNARAATQLVDLWGVEGWACGYCR